MNIDIEYKLNLIECQISDNKFQIRDRKSALLDPPPPAAQQPRGLTKPRELLVDLFRGVQQPDKLTWSQVHFHLPAPFRVTDSARTRSKDELKNGAL